MVAPTVGSKWRLLCALTIMGTLVMATSTGPWACWWSALLWAAPSMAALRCLPLPLALLVVVVTGVLGRALACAPSLDGLELLALPLAATAALLPALLVDKLLVTRFPVAGLSAWPALLALTWLLMREQATAAMLAPLPDLDATLLLSTLHPVLPVLVGGIVAQGFASMTSVLNWHVPDPQPQPLRERGVRIATLTTYAVLAAYFVYGVLL